MSNQDHVVCPACGAINRVPAARRGEGPSCGTCRAKLFPHTPIDVDSAKFDRHLAHDGVPLLVDVWAVWCGPCQSMAPQFARAAELLAPSVRLLKVNADENQALSQRYGIRGIPALLLFKDGQLAAQTAGAMDAGRIVDWTRSHL